MVALDAWNELDNLLNQPATPAVDSAPQSSGARDAASEIGALLAKPPTLAAQPSVTKAASSSLPDWMRAGLTIGLRGAGSTLNFLGDPLQPVRELISPQTEEVLSQGAYRPGTALGDKVFQATGVPEFKPTGPFGRVGMAAAEGAVGGGPFGWIPAGLSALGAGLSQTTHEIVPNMPRAAIAASLAPMALAPGASAIGARFAPHEAQAATALGNAIGRDARVGGPDINAIRTALGQENLPADLTPKPLAIADVAGTNVQGRGEAIANAPGPGAQIAENFLRERDKGAGTRTLADLNEGLGVGPSAYRTGQAIADRQAAQAAPLYEQAFSQNQAIASPEITAVLDTPAGKAALKAAQVKMQNDQSATGATDTRLPPELKLLLPEGYSMQMGPNGQMTAVRGAPGNQGFNLRTLDYVKRALDDQIGSKLRAGERDDARIMVGLKKQLVDAVEKADTTAIRDADGNITQPGLYNQARTTFAGHANALNAIDEGGKVFSKLPENIADEMADLSPNERQLYQLGARDALAKRISETSSGGNEALRIIGNQHVQDQLRPLFPDEQSYRAFIGQAQLESLMYRTGNNTLANSRTQRRAAFQAGEGEEAGSAGIGPIARSAVETGAVAMMHPAAALPALLRTVQQIGKGLSAKFGQPAPQVNENIARMLFSSDPTVNAATLDALRRAQQQPSPWMPAPMSLGGPLIGSQSAPWEHRR